MRHSNLELRESEPCACQPLDIPGTEIIARAIFYSFHVDKKGKLKWQAFKPDFGENDVSVMRTGCLTPTECKCRAKTMETSEKRYRGFLLLHAGMIRRSPFDVRDSRQVFCGHGDLLLNIPVLDAENGEPPDDPAITLKQREAGKSLLRLSVTRMDSDCDSDTWAVFEPWLPTDSELAGVELRAPR